MTTKENGGPAFPVTLFDGQTLGDGSANGMSLRDYFAAKAMPFVGELAPHMESNTIDGSFDLIAKLSYKIADAMLKARQS
jgi:hypothetical protein